MFKKSMLMFCMMALAFSISANAALVGLWEFNDVNDLTKATVGSDLTLNANGSHIAVAGIDATDGAARIGNGSHYIVANPIGANGGDGSANYSNQWTLLYDFKCALSKSYNSLLQTAPSNANDGDLFTRSSGAVGVSATGYSAGGALQADTWHRLVVRVDNGNLYEYWVDGVKVRTGTVQGVDGRFGLESTFLLFADNDGEEEDVDVSTVALWSQTLSEAEIVSLGTAGTVVPEPATMSLLALGAIGLIRRKR